MEIAQKVRRNLVLLRNEFHGEELPPFPTGPRTPYGACLRESFAVGEWQHKIYTYVEQGDWFFAEELARLLLQREETLERNCGVDTRRARDYLKQILEAIKKKDIGVKDLLTEHDTEILSALSVANLPWGK